VGESPLFCWSETGTQIAGFGGLTRRVQGERKAGRAVARALWRARTCKPLGDMELERIREAAERVARSVGIDVVDVEWKVGKQRFLRVYIDKPEGISHKDCETVSNQLSVILDVEDLVPGPHYILEVSSPGLDRKLTRPAEFERFAGRLAKISTNEPVENQKFFEGRLAGVADGKVQIEVNGRVIALPMEGIRKANLVVEL
jgi:ribosome maturation factor RimP